MRKRGVFWGVLSIIILSTVFKILWIKNIPLTPLYDFETFYKVAVNLYENKGFTLNGYPWAFQSYGYPLALSLFFRFMNNSDLVTAKLFNVICSTFTLPFIFFIFRKVFSKTSIVWICFVLFAFLPNNLIYNNVLGSEVLSVFIFSVIIYMNLCLNTNNNMIYFFLQGVFIGILSLVKPFFLAYPIVLVFIYFIKRIKPQKLANIGVSLVVGVAVVMIPSLIKNYNAFGKWFPISYNGGYTLYINNNSENIRGSWMNSYRIPASEEFKRKLKDVGFEYDVDHITEKNQNLRNAYSGEIFKDEAIKWIKSHPIEFFSLGCLRVINVFFDGASDVKLWGFENLDKMTITQNRIFKVFMGVADTIIYVISTSFIFLIILNIKKIFSNKADFSLLLVCWSVLFFYAVYFVIEGQARYNFPTLFLLLISFGWIFEKIESKDTSAM